MIFSGARTLLLDYAAEGKLITVRQRSTSLSRTLPLWSTVRQAMTDEDGHAVCLNNSVVSRCLAMIGAERPIETPPTCHWPCLATNCPFQLDPLIVETLMIPLVMVLRERLWRMRFSSWREVITSWW